MHFPDFYWLHFLTPFIILLFSKHVLRATLCEVVFTNKHCIAKISQTTCISGIRMHKYTSLILRKVDCVCSVTRSCSTLCDPKNCSPPRSSVYGILQARILEWVAISFSRLSSQSRDQTRVSCVSCIARGFFTTEPLGKPLEVN